MEKNDYQLQIKYSIRKISEDGKQKIFSKKRKKTIKTIDPLEIIDDLNAIDKTFSENEHYMDKEERSGFWSSIKNYINKWKFAYYEMLQL